MKCEASSMADLQKLKSLVFILKEKWVEAKGEEVTWEQLGVSTEWIVTEKEMEQGQTKVKARLVVMGNMEQDLPNCQMQSITCGKESVRLMLSLAAMKELSKRENGVYIVPSRDIADDGMIWKATGNIYGLRDAEANLRREVLEHLVTIGGEVESMEVKVQQTRISTEWLITQKEVELVEFLHLVSSRGIVDEGTIWKAEGNIYALGDEEANLRRNVLVHLVMIGRGMSAVVLCLVLVWKEGKILGVVALEYCGIQLKLAEKVVFMQSRFEDNEGLGKVEVLLKIVKKVSDEFGLAMRQGTGKFNLVAQGTRSDFGFRIVELSIPVKEEVVGYIKEIRKCVKIDQKVRKDIKLFTLMGYIKIVGFIVAALNDKDDMVLSEGGYVVFLMDEQLRSEWIMWMTSTKIKRVVRRSLIAEALIALDVIKRLVEEQEDIWEASIVVSIFIFPVFRGFGRVNMQQDGIYKKKKQQGEGNTIVMEEGTVEIKKSKEEHMVLEYYRLQYVQAEDG